MQGRAVFAPVQKAQCLDSAAGKVTADNTYIMRSCELVPSNYIDGDGNGLESELVGNTCDGEACLLGHQSVRKHMRW